MSTTDGITEKPESMFRLRQWREHNGLTTPEWEMYIKARGKLEAISYLTAFFMGLVAGIGGAMI